MSKRNAETIFHGSVPCQAKKNNGDACTNGAYYKQENVYLCGVHSDKKKRNELPHDKDAKKKRLDVINRHNERVREAAEGRQNGELRCYKMKMMKEVPLVDGFMNVFPNNKHQNRLDGIGCAGLSPMQLGPVQHQQPGLPICKNIENYHQFNKVWPNEVDNEKNPLPIFFERQKEAYQDAVPHRHKFDAKQMSLLRKQVDGQNRNQPCYAIVLSLNGEQKRFSYVQSRFFYCKAYEVLAKKTGDFKMLRDLLTNGTNLIICGYDAYPVTMSLYEHYCDPTHPFGHELVLYTLLTIDDPLNYPWNIYKQNHLDVYENIAHV
jgi:hypothetical protein